MREILGMIGVCLIGMSVTTYFVDLRAGTCMGMFLVGACLVIDAVRK